MSLTTKVLIGLLAGLSCGIAISVSGSPALAGIVGWVEPIGTLWVNAIRMTVIPLVIALLIVGVAGTTDAGAIRRLGGGAMLLFVVLLSLIAALSTLVAEPIFSLLTIAPEVSASLRASAAAGASTAAEGASQVPSFLEWVVTLVPTNPFRAAADGAMLPLIVFTIAFGLSLTRIADGPRAQVVGFFRAIGDSMLVLVQWVLAWAPLGVFALALPLAVRMGVAAAGALAFYVLVVSLIVLAVMAFILYPAAVLVGKVPLGRFARAIFPAQAVAFSSRSSLAALPALIEECDRKLHFPPQVTSFFLPLSASVFRVGTAVGLPVGVIFIARLFGVELGPAQLLAIAVTTVLLSFSVPGIPAGSIFIMAPVLLAAGVPVEGLGILLGVDTIPDMVRTAANVTGHAAAGSILARREGASVPVDPELLAGPEDRRDEAAARHL